MYQRYLSDPASVDPAWHEFFADYQPTPERAAGTVETSVPTTGRPAPSEDGKRAVPPPAAARPAQPPTPKPAQAKPAQAKPAPAPPAQPPTPQPVDADSAAQPGTRSTAPAPARPAGPRGGGGRGSRTAARCRSAGSRPGSPRTWISPSASRPPPAYGRCRRSCWRTTGSSSTTALPGAGAARSASPT